MGFYAGNDGIQPRWPGLMKKVQLIYGKGSFVNNIMDSTAEGRLPGYTKYAVNVNY